MSFNERKINATAPHKKWWWKVTSVSLVYFQLKMDEEVDFLLAIGFAQWYRVGSWQTFLHPYLSVIRAAVKKDL